jgi:hypothetical protein
MNEPSLHHYTNVTWTVSNLCRGKPVPGWMKSLHRAIGASSTLPTKIHPLAPQVTFEPTPLGRRTYPMATKTNSGGREFWAVPTLMKMVKNNSTDRTL